MPAVAAIDQGTTSSRALVVSGGRARIVRAIEHRQFYPRPGWVEQDAEELLRNVRACIDACVGAAALGIANQGESCVAWSADNGQPVSPVITWQDDRSRAAVEQLRQDGAEALVAERAGLPLDPYFSASKLAWLARLPEAKALHRRGKLRLGTTDAFFLDRLTGRFVTDLSTASRTSLLNLRAGKWDTDLCELFGVPLQALPEITATTGDFGAVAPGGGPGRGRRKIPVTASVVDQQASLVGHGCRAPGDTKITFGTGAFALAVSGPAPAVAPLCGLTPTVAWQLAGRAPIYALEGGVHCAGAAVNWARELGLFKSFADIDAFTRPPAIARDLVFVPALTGLACPHWDARARGMWLGLSLDTRAPDLMQALLEGIAFRTAEVINAMAGVVGAGGIAGATGADGIAAAAGAGGADGAGGASLTDALSIDGGVSANRYFCQFLANVLARRIVARNFAELTALGAAQLAAHGRDLATGGDGELAVAMPPNATADHIYEPTEDLTGHTARFTQAVKRAADWMR
ncbi:MAG: FGGY family carbohydrate kinase [Gammaproteobacteria bacterium]|nr:FGGY family carbohydrate kinase [Gammaproteobacteria bacterium]